METIEYYVTMDNPVSRIRLLMDDQNLNQQELAMQVGYDFTSISKFLNNRSPISDKFLRQAEDKLGWSSRWIRTGDGPRRISINRNESINTDQSGNRNTSNVNYKGAGNQSAESEIERLKQELAQRDEKIEDLKTQKKLLEEINQLLRNSK